MKTNKIENLNNETLNKIVEEIMAKSLWRSGISKSHVDGKKYEDFYAMFKIETLDRVFIKIPFQKNMTSEKLYLKLKKEIKKELEAREFLSYGISEFKPAIFKKICNKNYILFKK